MGITRIVHSGLTAAGLAALALGAGPVAASAAKLETRVIATQPSQQREGFAAGYGYVAWIESSRGGQRQRVALRDGGKLRRSGWFAGRDHQLALGRQVDQRTGKVVVRVSVTRRRSDGRKSKPTLLSPATLRRTATKWPAAPEAAGTLRAVDGARSVEIRSEPFGTEPDAEYGKYRSSRCRATMAQLSLPVLDDCSARGAILRGSRLVVWSLTPSVSSIALSKGGGKTITAWHAISLDQPERGWTLVGRRSADWDGSRGLQDVCLLDDGLALLSGDFPSLDATDPATWNLRFLPADPKRAPWSASAASIASSSEWLATELGCSKRTLYARYTALDRKNGVPRTRIVRVKAR